VAPPPYFLVAYPHVIDGLGSLRRIYRGMSKFPIRIPERCASSTRHIWKLW
jgi:hypothetical protein